MCRVIVAVAVALGFGFAPAEGARAQESVDGAPADGPTTESASNAPRGDGRAALPGLLHTRLAAERPRGFAVRALGAYGYTESVGPVAGAHHQAAMSLGLSGQPLRWLGLGVSLDGRYDAHPDDGAGRDTGFVTSSMFELRATPRVGTNGLALGVVLAAFGYGNTNAALDIDALSFEGTALATFAPAGGRWFVGGEVGYRLDRSDAAAPIAPAVLRPGDRLALGLSSYDAILVRLGGGVHVGPLDLYGEFSLDALVGSGAPRFGVSPMHVALGARYPIGAAMHVELFVDGGLASRPAIPAAGPYVRIDPRVAAGLAFAYRFGGAGAPDVRVSDEAPDEGTTPDATDPDLDPARHGTTDPERPPGRVLEARLLDASGAPLVDAHVVVTVGTGDGSARLETFSDAEGRFVLAGIPDGDVTLSVEAVSHVPFTQSLGAGSLEVPGGIVRLELASAHGVLRGLVRGFDGEAIAATITVMPGHHQAASDAAGEFELALPPGRYSVRLAADGYTNQTREVTLADGGVTILNVELRRDR